MQFKGGLHPTSKGKTPLSPKGKQLRCIVMHMPHSTLLGGIYFKKSNLFAKV